jgi:hypothetical protein
MVLETQWLQTGLLLLVPAMILAAIVLLGRYPGEELLLRPSCRPRRPRRRLRRQPARRSPARSIGGGLLIGLSLAGRAPPLHPSCL